MLQTLRTFLCTLLALGWASELHAQSTATGPQDTLAVLTVLYRRAFELGLRTAHASEKPALVCIAAGRSDPVASFVSTLADSSSLLVRPASACRTEPLGIPSTSGSLVVDTLTGRRGIKINVFNLAFPTADAYSAHITYWENGLSGAYWECTGRRQRGRWDIPSCRMTSIS